MSRKVDPLLLGVLAVAFGLRLQGIDDDGFWLDEVTSLCDADRPVAAILLGKGKPGHPPLYYLLLKAWVALFGTSETAVRLLSAVFGTAAVGATCALFRLLHGRAAGLAASLLLALSFHHIVFSQEARNYALFGFLAVLSAHALWRAVAEGGGRRWVVYIACAVIMAYTHHQAYVVLLAGAAGAVLAATIGGMRKGALRSLALADAVVLAVAAPSIVLYLLGGGNREYGFWQPHVSWQGLADVAALWTPGSPLLAPGSFLYAPNPPTVPWLPWLPLALLLPAALLALAWRGDPSPRPPPTLFHLGTLYMGLGAFVVIALLKPLWHVRYVLVFLPFYLGGVGGLLAAPRPSARIAAVTVAVALSLPGLVEEKRVPGRTPWREAAAHVAARECPAVYLIGPSSLGKPFGWYYKRPFEVVPGAAELVVAARRAVEGGGRVLVIYCNAHGPPDPRHTGARELAATLEVRGAAHFGPLHVYEFAKRPR